MVYMSENVEAGCDSAKWWPRCMGCEPCCFATFEAKGDGAYVGLTPNRPAKVLPLVLGGRRFLGKKGMYFASTAVWESTGASGCRPGSVERWGTGIATPSSRRCADGVENDAMIQNAP